MKREGLGDLAAVEAALVEMARDVPVRASSMTLIAVGLEDVREAKLARSRARMEPAARRGGADLARALTQRHPGRVLALDLRPDSPERFAADIEADAHYEVILLRVGGAAAAHPAALAEPLLLRNLPVVLWWPGDWPPDAGLLEAADRVICDSAGFGDAAAGLRGLAELARRSETTGCAPGDLNWTRLLPWRQRTARWFDQPERLRALDGVRLQYAVQPAQAWLFHGWLHSRLGRDLPCELRAVDRGGPGLVRAELAGLELADLPAGEVAQLLATEMDMPRDPYYEAAVTAAAETHGSR